MRNARIVLLLLLGCYGAAAAAEDFVDPPGRVARLSFIDGDVSIAPPGSDQWGEALLNRPLTTGDRLWADDGARAELEVGSATLRIDENTGVAFDNLTDDVMQIQLTSGVMALHVGSLGAGQIVEVVTPNTTINLLQRGDYTIETTQSGDQTIVKTRSGEATVAGSSQQAYGVATNEQGIFSGTADFTSEIAGIGPQSRFEEWAYAREIRDQESVSARYVSREVIGYRDLDTYGTWYSEPEYGHVWRPTRLVDDWAPYRYGRWIWVAPWGWTWVDDAPWGFASSHYGRWAYLRNRWCWVPGPPHLRPVYAPALVGWVGDPFGNPNYIGNVGWFPLAPREPYLPGYRTSWRHFHNVNVSNTVIVNNTYINNAYRGRAAPFEYHNRRVPHALTVVQRDAFTSARRVGDHRERVSDEQVRKWTAQGRTPTITPNQDSMIGTRVTAPRAAPRSDRWVNSNRTAVAPAEGRAPATRVPATPTSSRQDRTDQNASVGRPDHDPRNDPRVQTDARAPNDARVQNGIGTRPTNRAPADATPHGAPSPHGNPAATPPAVTPQVPAEQHVQRQWNGRHDDNNARAPNNAVVPAPQQQSTPKITTRQSSDPEVRPADPRQSDNVRLPPRPVAPTAPAAPAAPAPDRQQAPPPAQGSQRAAFGTPHGRNDQQDNRAAHQRSEAPGDRTRQSGPPPQQPESDRAAAPTTLQIRGPTRGNART